MKAQVSLPGGKKLELSAEVVCATQPAEKVVLPVEEFRAVQFHNHGSHLVVIMNDEELSRWTKEAAGIVEIHTTTVDADGSVRRKGIGLGKSDVGSDECARYVLTFRQPAALLLNGLRNSDGSIVYSGVLDLRLVNLRTDVRVDEGSGRISLNTGDKSKQIVAGERAEMILAEMKTQEVAATRESVLSDEIYPILFSDEIALKIPQGEGRVKYLTMNREIYNSLWEQAAVRRKRLEVNEIMTEALAQPAYTYARLSGMAISAT